MGALGPKVLMTLPSTILAIDPGLATGIAVVTQKNGNLSIWSARELDPIKTGAYAQAMLSDPFVLGASDLEIVIERFTITAATAKNSQAPWSLEVIGMIKWLVHDELNWDPDTIIMQGPAEAKRLITNDILKKHGLWHKGGQGHANDAIRHAVYRYARLGWRKPWEEESV